MQGVVHLAAADSSVDRERGEKSTHSHTEKSETEAPFLPLTSRGFICYRLQEGRRCRVRRVHWPAHFRVPTTLKQKAGALPRFPPMLWHLASAAPL